MTETTLAWLNALDPAAAREAFRRCCGSSWWCDRMAAGRPYGDAAELASAAESAFDAAPREAWLEAFAAHPRIGDLDSLRMKFAGNRDWSAGEQAGASAADEATLRGLADGNDAYFERFGYTFIVCATGKSAAEMLAILEERLGNDDATELAAAAEQQRKITRLRLAKLEPE